MSTVPSVDLHTRVLAAERFGVGAGASASGGTYKLRRAIDMPVRQVVTVIPTRQKPMLIIIMMWLSEHRDGTLFELCDTLAAKGIVISKLALNRFLIPNVKREKKTGHVVE